MKVLLVAMAIGITAHIFANGGFHGGYFGKGTMQNSCGGSKEFTSTFELVGHDGGTDLYYGLKYADGVEHIVSSTTLLARWKAVNGHGLISG